MSINKVATITVDDSREYPNIIRVWTESLINSGGEIKLNGDKVKIVRCTEFSTATAFLKDFNGDKQT